MTAFRQTGRQPHDLLRRSPRNRATSFRRRPSARPLPGRPRLARFPPEDLPRTAPGGQTRSPSRSPLPFGSLQAQRLSLEGQNVRCRAGSVSCPLRK